MEDRRWWEVGSLWACSSPKHNSFGRNSHSYFVTNKLRFLSSITQLMVTCSLSAWSCHSFCNPWIRRLLCIHTDNIDNGLRASSCAKWRKNVFLSPPLHIFPPGIILFILGRGWTLFALGLLTKCLSVDIKLFYWVMIWRWAEIKGPEIALQDNSQMPPSFPPLIFIQLFSSIRFKMN